MENLPALNTIPLDSKHTMLPKATRRHLAHDNPPLDPRQLEALASGHRSVLQSAPVTEIMSSQYQDDYHHPPMHEVVQRRLLILIIWVIVMMGLSIAVVSQLYDGAALPILNNVSADVSPQEVAVAPAQSTSNGIISPIFSKEVQQWAPQIQEWSRTYGVDANQIATIMQIESCGDPYAESWVGAQGLFQVMPFHFEEHENMKDPDTNAYRGINYFRERMTQTGGDVGRSFAGYNGGHGASGSPYDQWPTETKHYYYWATGIYEDALSDKQISERLDEWMVAGGYSLCQQASASLGLR